MKISWEACATKSDTTIFEGEQNVLTDQKSFTRRNTQQFPKHTHSMENKNRLKKEVPDTNMFVLYQHKDTKTTKTKIVHHNRSGKFFFQQRIIICK